MSTKTSIKRIALVAAAALTLGGFSVISSESAHAATTASVAVSGTGTTSTVGTAGLAYTATAIGDGAHFPTVTITAGSSDTAYLITSTGVGTMYGVATTGSNSGSVIYNNATSTTGGFGWYKLTSMNTTSQNFVDTNTVAFAVTSAVAGVQVITITPVNATNSAITETITWGAAPAATAQYSTAYISTVKTDSATADVASITVPNTAGSQQAVISVTLNSAASTTISGAGLKAEISGPGTLGIANPASFPAANNAAYNTAATGRSLSVAAAGSNAYYLVTVWGDGTSGASTITLTSGTTVIATKTLTFVGAAAKAKATQGLYVLKAGGATPGTGAGANASSTDGSAATTVAATPAIIANVVDANGNPTTGTVKIVSSDSTVLVAGSCTQVTVSTTVVNGTYNCQVNGASGAASGAKATITFEVLNTTTGLYDILATPLTFSIGGATAKQSIAFDASSYSALNPLSIIVTNLDSAGNKAYDVDGVVVSATPTASTQLGGAALTTVSASAASINGVATFKGFYAPQIGGDFSVTALDVVTGAAMVAKATSTAVGGDSSLALDAANAATDAANNAYDEAQNATQAASDALAAVKALAVQVKALIALVTKIKNKVGA